MGKNLAEAAADSSEESAMGVVWQGATKHLQNVLSPINRNEQSGQVGAGEARLQQGSRGGNQVARMRKCLVILAL